MRPLRRAATARLRRGAAAAAAASDAAVQLADAVIRGERRALSRAITLVESTNPEHWPRAEAVQQLVQQGAQRQGRRCLRVGLSGPPGTGKSTMIDTLGTHLTKMGKRVVVLAVDPSSKVSGGSLLGDKTRMDRLAVDPLAYIRPSPTSGALGGLTEAAHETLLLCEGAGWDVALVETVGVGQSETAARELTDCFVLLIPPSSGDELQGMKKGIVEVADIVCVTKADGPTADLAKAAQLEYKKALQLVCPFGRAEGDWKPPVLRCSSRANNGMGDGIAELWDTVVRYTEAEAAAIERRRRAARQERLWGAVRREMLRRAESDPRLTELLAAQEEEVRGGTLVPRLAARRLIDAWLGGAAAGAAAAA